MKRFLPIFALALLPTITNGQQLDAEASKEYELNVVVRCGAHNWLGKSFRDDLRGNLAGMLADALGAMAQVTVVDLKEQKEPAKWPAVWREVESRGLGALDSFRDAPTGKTHFVQVDYVNGQYEIQARQIDGQTGLVSPWRHERTTDRAFVARLAGKLIASDFGLIGAVTPRGSAANGEIPVTIRFKAGALGVPLDRWIKQGDVFALLAVAPARGEGGREMTERQRDIVVVVTGGDLSRGSCEAQLVYRYEPGPFQKSPGLGFRCIKLASTTGPMRLRLVDERGQPHSRALQVAIHAKGFQTGAISSAEEVVNPDRGGFFVSRTPYDRIGFVRIITGNSELARMPVPILEDGEVRVTVALNAAADTAAQLQSLRGQLYRQYLEAVTVQSENYRVISALVNKANNTEAVKKAKASLAALEQDIERLKVAKEDVKKQLANSNLNVNDCDELEEKQLKGKHMRNLHRLIGQLEEFIRLDNSPDKVEARQKLLNMQNQVQVLLDSDDYDGAITLLKKMFADYPAETKVKEQLDRLEREWAIKSADHDKARTFVYREWPAIKTAAEISAKLPAARQHLQVIGRVGDRLTLLKLRNSLPAVSKVLQGEISAVASDSEDTEKQAKLKKIVEDFDKFVQEVEAAVNAAATPM